MSRKALEKKPVDDWSFEDLWEDSTGHRPTKEETAKVLGRRPKRRRVWRQRDADTEPSNKLQRKGLNRRIVRKSQNPIAIPKPILTNMLISLKAHKNSSNLERASNVYKLFNFSLNCDQWHAFPDRECARITRSEKTDKLNAISLTNISVKSKIELLKGLGYGASGGFVTKDNKRYSDPYTNKPVKISNMAILPGSAIVIDDNPFSLTEYLEDYKKEI